MMPKQPAPSTAPLWWLLLAVFMIGLVSMPREEYIADPMVERCETVSLINHRSLNVPAEVVLQFGGDRGQYFVENAATKKWFSKYGVLNGIMYVPPLLFEKFTLGQLSYFSESRVTYLNFFNLTLTLGTVSYLFLIASRYTRSVMVTVIFILTSLYCTYWWNYLRAQNSEIYQTLFMLGFYYHLTSIAGNGTSAFLNSSRKNQRIHLFLAGIFAGLLILAKTVYVILIPMIGISLLLREIASLGSVEKLLSLRSYNEFFRKLAWIGVPISFALCVLLAVNAHKFGSPFESGYSQWQERGNPIFSGHFLSGLYGFLFQGQHSIFLHFPILAFAVFGCYGFYRKHRFDTAFSFGLGLIWLLIHSKLLEWPGGWSYGPRYMLPVLPLLSLPFIQTLEILFTSWRNMWVAACAIIVTAVLAYSLELQLNVNALPFFVYYRLQGVFAQLHDAEIDRYFAQVQFGRINGDILDYKNGKSLYILDKASSKLTPDDLIRLKSLIRIYSISNYYFWPDAHDIPPKAGGLL